MSKNEAAALVGVAVVAGAFRQIELDRKVRFMMWAGPENLEASSAALAACHPTHDNFVGRIVKGWAAYRRG